MNICFINVIFLLIVTFQLQSVIATTVNATTVNATTVKTYYVSYIWPSGYCTAEPPCENRRPGRYFTMHGLWPADANLKPINDICHGAPWKDFDNALKKRLEEDWPSYNHPSTSFWKHEWNRHGKCTGFSQDQYFRLGLRLVSRRGRIISSLHSQGIVENTDPDNSFVIRKYLIALQTGGFHHQLRCLNKDGRYYITEVRQCVDLNLNSINCPTDNYWSRVGCGSVRDIDRAKATFHLI